MPTGEKLTVDEKMVSFKGRNRLKQYLPALCRTSYLIAAYRTKWDQRTGINGWYSTCYMWPLLQQCYCLGDIVKELARDRTSKWGSTLSSHSSLKVSAKVERVWFTTNDFPVSRLLKKYDMKRRKGPVAPIPVPDERLDPSAHWMIITDKKARCKEPGSMWHTNTIFALTSNCFYRFHME